MNTSPKKSRKTTLLILGVIALLVFICVDLMRRESGSGIFASSDTRNGFPTRASDDSVSSPATLPKDMDDPAVFSSVTEASGVESNGGSHPYAAPLSPPATGSLVATGLASTAVGVVDLEKLIAAHSSGADSEDTRAATMRDIRRIVALRAKAHGFAFVFDISAKSLSAPFLLATNGVPDITDEVLQELSR